MRKAWLLAAGAALFASGAAIAAPKLTPEAQLQRAVEGRVAGEPVNCINLRDIRSTQIIDGTAIVYDAGRTVYVNRPRAGEKSLDRWDTLVTKTPSGQLCSVDTVQLYDAPSRMLSGIVFLGDFVPYRRPAKAD